MTFLNVVKNEFTFSSISNEELKIDLRNKNSCCDNEIEVLILLKIVELNYTKDHYKTTN